MELDFNIDKDLKEIFKLSVKIYQRESRITDYGSNKLFLLLLSFFAACKLSSIDVEKDYAIEEPSLAAISQLFTVMLHDVAEDEIHRGTMKEIEEPLKKVFSIMNKSNHEECDIYDYLFAFYIQDPEEFKSVMKAFPDMKLGWEFDKSDAKHLILGRSASIIEDIVNNCDEETKMFFRNLNIATSDAETTIDCLFEEEIIEKKDDYPVIAVIDALTHNSRYKKIFEEDKFDALEWEYIQEEYGIGENHGVGDNQYMTEMFIDIFSNTVYLCNDINNITLDDFVKAFFKRNPTRVKDVFENILFVDTFYNTKISKAILSDTNKAKKKEVDLNKELEDYENDMEILKDYGEFLDEKEFSRKPALGREREMKKALITLLTPEKSVMLIGDAGVGKTAIVEGIASKIKKGRIPKQLKGMKILKVTTSKLVEGCKYVGTFEEKMEELFDVLKKHPNIILNIDEIHTAIGLGQGSNGNLDFANILKPYLDRGTIRLITSTTEEEYEKIIQEDEAFRRRFEKINVKEPEKDTLFEILNQRLEDLKELYKIDFPYSTNDRNSILNEIVDLTKKNHRVYNDNQNNPDLSLSILSKAFAYAAYDNKEELDADDIANAIDDCDRIYDTARNSAIGKIKQFKKTEKGKEESKVIKLEFE